MRSSQQVGRAVADLRRAAGLRQHDLAPIAGISRSSLANIEAGRQGMPLETIAQVAAALGTTVSALLGEEPATAVPPALLAKVAGQQRDITKTLREACELMVVLAQESEAMTHMLAQHGITVTGQSGDPDA